MTFYSSIAFAYDRIFPFDQDLGQFLRLLQPKDPCRFLDIGCATGHLANSLAGAGNEVVGIDLDPEMVRLAGNRFGNTRVSFRIGDMSRLGGIFPPESFDFVTCFGNTLVHLPDPSSIEAMLRSVFSLLRPGGVFAGQIINYDRILEGRLPGLPKIDRGDLEFERRYLYQENDARILFETVLKGRETPPLTNRVFLYPLTSDELGKALDRSGFTVAPFFSDTDRSPIGKESFALYFAAEKP